MEKITKDNAVTKSEKNQNRDEPDFLKKLRDLPEKNFVSPTNIRKLADDKKFNNFINKPSQSKKTYDFLFEKKYQNLKDTNLKEMHQKDLHQQLNNLKDQYQDIENKQIKNKAKFPWHNLDQNGKPIFKATNTLDKNYDVDKELDKELEILRNTMEMPLPKFKSKVKNDDVKIISEDLVRKEKIEQNQASKITKEKNNDDKELLLVQAKIALAKIEKEKIESEIAKAKIEAEKAKAEAEREYYKTQTIQLDKKRKIKPFKRFKNKKNTR